MKINETIDLEQHVAAWKARYTDDFTYSDGTSPAFSPAVQAQASPYGSSGTGDIPGFTSLHHVLIANDFTGWMDECKSISETCYIGDWSWLNMWRISGPDAIKCLEASSINGYKKLPVGKGRHFISVGPDGKMIGDAIVFREGEERFFLTGAITLAPGAMLRPEGLDVQLEELTGTLFNYHVQGPNSTKVIEKVCGEDVSDLEFIHFRDVTICGQACVLYRGGMSGELGYEIFGDASYGSVIWKAVVEAGEEFGIRQMGYRPFMTNHLQAFFPTIWIDFVPDFVPGAEAMYRFPSDFGWGGLVDKTRDFPGKDAIMAEVANPTHKTMMLEWNSEDVKAIHDSLFDPDNEPFEQMPMPVNTSEPGEPGPMALPVFDENQKFVGLATNRGYSYQFRRVISITWLETRVAEVGRELFVLWGTEGKRQMRIRATVAEAPYKKDVRK